jgi:hypothetical protein
MARVHQEALSVGCRVTVDPVFHAGELAFLTKHPYSRNLGGPLKPGDIGVISEVATIGGTSAPIDTLFASSTTQARGGERSCAPPSDGEFTAATALSNAFCRYPSEALQVVPDASEQLHPPPPAGSVESDEAEPGVVVLNTARIGAGRGSHVI